VIWAGGGAISRRWREKPTTPSRSKARGDPSERIAQFGADSSIKLTLWSEPLAKLLFEDVSCWCAVTAAAAFRSDPETSPIVASTLADLEDSIARGSQQHRLDSLRQVTDLFLRDAVALSDDQIELFDLVIARLAAAIETRARAELASRLADAPNAPRGVLRALAHDEIVVARPILSRCRRLTDDDLVAVAVAKGRDHMLAISEREALAETVTDVLVSRGDCVVMHAVAGNPGSRFTEGGIAKLIDRCRDDAALQTLLGQRQDVPEAHMRQLVLIAKEEARRRLVATLPQATPPALDAAVERGATGVEAVALAGRDYGRAIAAVQELADAGLLAETKLRDLAEADALDETVCAIASLVGLSIPAAARIFGSSDPDLLLVVGKSQDWVWPTVRALVKLRDNAEATPARLKRIFETYEQLSRKTAQRVVHFLKVRETAQKEAAETAARRQLRSKLR
jgi:uncharacterized protein (DUF2336 family)